MNERVSDAQRSLRVLLVSEDVPYPSMGGLAIHALALARALVTTGHYVDFLCGNQFPQSLNNPQLGFGGRFFPELCGHRVGWWETRIGAFVPAKRSWLARRFARIILRRARNYDVVHYHGHVPNLARYLPLDLNFVQTRHDQGSECLMHTRFRNGGVCAELDPRECASCMQLQPNYFQIALSTSAVKRFRRETAEAFRRHKTVFVSDMLRRNFGRTAGAGPWGWVIHNFADRSSIDSAAASAVRLADVPVYARVVVFAGKLYPPKGIEPFLGCIVPRLGADTHLLVIGDGPQEQALRERFESSRVHFTGWMDRGKSLQLVASADQVVVPSVGEESCATTILEGLMLGKPTFALSRGGSPELSAYQLYPGQLSLHDSMDRLVDALLTPLTLSARIAISAWDAEQAAARLLAIYRLPPAATAHGL